MSQTIRKPKITLKNCPKAKPHLYELKLAFRAECYADISKVLAEFEFQTEKVENNLMKGYIGEFHSKQSELHPGTYIPDFDVPIISFRIWVEETKNASAIMSQMIGRFLDSIENIPDTHVIRQSINLVMMVLGMKIYRSIPKQTF